MFGIGLFELLVIAVALLVFVGPKKLPEVMRQAGKLFVQLRRTANDVRGTFDQVIKDAEEDIRKEEQAALKELLAAKAAATGDTVTTTATQLPAAHDPGHPHPDAPAGAMPLTSPHTAAHVPPAVPDEPHSPGETKPEQPKAIMAPVEPAAHPQEPK